MIREINNKIPNSNQDDNPTKTKSNSHLIESNSNIAYGESYNRNEIMIETTGDHASQKEYETNNIQERKSIVLEAIERKSIVLGSIEQVKVQTDVNLAGFKLFEKDTLKQSTYLPENFDGAAYIEKIKQESKQEKKTAIVPSLDLQKMQFKKNQPSVITSTQPKLQNTLMTKPVEKQEERMSIKKPVITGLHAKIYYKVSTTDDKGEPITMNLDKDEYIAFKNKINFKEPKLIRKQNHYDGKAEVYNFNDEHVNVETKVNNNAAPINLNINVGGAASNKRNSTNQPVFRPSNDIKNLNIMTNILNNLTPEKKSEEDIPIQKQPAKDNDMHRILSNSNSESQNDDNLPLTKIINHINRNSNALLFENCSENSLLAPFYVTYCKDKSNLNLHKKLSRK